VHVKNSLGVEKGLEKGEAHEMIPVGMGEKEMKPGSLLGCEAVAEPAQTGSCVNDDYFIVLGADFKAGGVAPVNQIFRAGNSNGTAGTPASDAHGNCLASQG
jgi:hypothetical protein